MKNFRLLLMLILSGPVYGQNLYTTLPCKNSPYNLPAKNLIIATLDSFLKEKDLRPDSNRFWSTADLALWREPYIELWNEGTYKQRKDYYRPSLLGIIDLPDPSKYIVKLALIGNDDSVNNSIKLVYNLIANYDTVSQKVVFEKYTNYFLKDWDSTTVGNITYYKRNIKHLNLSQCSSLNRFNDSMAKLWRVPAIKFVHFSCKNPIEMFNLKGYDFYPAMFFAKTGGQVYYGGQSGPFNHIIFAGNDRESYPHEVTHFYINQNEVHSRLAAEGVATFLGGSADKPLEFHLHYLSKYLKANKDIRIDSLLSTEFRIEQNVSTLYSLGGLLAKILFRRGGISSLKQFLLVEEKDLRTAIPKLLNKSAGAAFDAYIRAELRNYENVQKP